MRPLEKVQAVELPLADFGWAAGLSNSKKFEVSGRLKHPKASRLKIR